MSRKLGRTTSVIDVLMQLVVTDVFEPRKISAGIPTPYTLDWIDPDYDSGAHFLSSRLVKRNSSGETTVSDILESNISLLRVQWSVLVLHNLPVRLESWDPPIWRGYFGELKGLDLLKLGAEPGVLGGLTDTGRLNSLLKFFHVMGDFVRLKMGTEYFIVPGRS